jgi:hypothetical protein
MTHPPPVSSILLKDYVAGVAGTDLLDRGDIRPVLMGLYGEVGSIMATAKKTHREQTAYVGFRKAAEEEFGDALWYLNALAIRTGDSLPEVFTRALSSGAYNVEVASSGFTGGVLAHVFASSRQVSIDEALLELGESTSALLALTRDRSNVRSLLANFGRIYLAALQASDLNFSTVIRNNLDKVRGGFLPPEFESLPQFDGDFADEERIPQRFEISVSERKSGRSYLQWNGVYLGDPLTDNIAASDGYRYHDVFHLAHAAILHWSPVFRALIKHKRKSDRIVDETQDSGRAIVVEEGLSAWLFTRAKELHFFEGQTRVSLDLLKTVQQFVQGYEVDQCPLSLWERAILQGYAAFRELKKNGGGLLICDRFTRTIKYQPFIVSNDT